MSESLWKIYNFSFTPIEKWILSIFFRHCKISVLVRNPFKANMDDCVPNNNNAAQEDSIKLLMIQEQNT